MQWFDTVLCLLALFALCAFFTARCGVNGAVAPLLSFSCILLLLTVGGIAGLLVPAGWFLYIACAGLLAFTLFSKGVRQTLASLLNPGFLFFAAAGIALLVLLAVRQPVFHENDEFSLWGTAAKLMKLNGTLYTTAPMGWVWPATQSPGLILPGFFSQFFGAGFAAWKSYFGLDLLLLACLAPLFAPLQNKDWRYWVPLACIGLLLPFFFTVTVGTVYLAPAYLSTYGDLPAGFLFGGALAVWFALRRPGQDAAGHLRPWPVLPVLALFALAKDNTLPIVLVAAAIMAADLLFFGREYRGRPLQKAGTILALFAAPLAAYWVWGRHTAWVVAQNPFTGGAETGVSPAGAAVQGLLQLFNPAARSEKFSQTLADMGSIFFNGDHFGVSMAGSAFLTCLFILAVFLAAALLAPNRQGRLRVGLAALLSSLGFVGYQFVLLVTYAFIMKTDTAYADYGRYLSSYYAGWLMLALALLLPAARQAGLRYTAGAVSAAALACAGCLLFSSLVHPGFSVLDYPDATFRAERNDALAAEKATAHLQTGDRVFFVSQGDTGVRWLMNSYYFLPYILDYSNAGGTFGPPLPAGAEAPSPYYNPMMPEEMEAHLFEYNCNYIYIEQADELFIETYSSLFADGLQSLTGQPSLYRRLPSGLYERVY